MIKLIPVLLLFFTFSFLFRSDPAFDQDLGRHIKLGEIIANTHSVPKTNLFSYTNPDFPFINTHWMFEVIAYFFDQTIGINWLLYLKIAIILCAILLTIYTPGVSNLLLPVGFIFLHVLRERLDLRPEIFSFLFTALTYYLLRKQKALFLLPIIQFIWINTHIYFFIGLILQAIFLVTQKSKKLLIIFLLSIAACLINPNGLDGLLYPLKVQSNYGYTIVENQTMSLLESIGFLDRNFLFVKISLSIIILSIFVGLKRRTLTLTNLFLVTFGSSLAMLNVRGFPYLLFICLPAVLENFGETKINKILILFTAILLFLESFLYLNGNYYKYTNSTNQVGLTLPESGKGALDFVSANNLPGPIYNNFDIGSYLIYRGKQVFVDGRPEAYPKELFQETYIPTQYDYQKFKELEKKWGFKTIIFSHTDQTPWGKTFLTSLAKDQDWNLVYLDDFMVVYTKENIKPVKLSEFSNHVSYLRIALYLMTTQNTSQANLFYNKALEIFPDLQKSNNLYFW